VVREEQAVEEMVTRQAMLAPPARASSSDEDVAMVLADDGGSAPSPPVREHDVTMLAAPKSSAGVTTTLIEGAADASSSRYVDFLGIGIIDLDATELPSKEREILEVTVEQMSAYPSTLDAIMSVPPVPRQDEGAGGLVPPAAPEVAEAFSGSP
jgi:hypothetical protein